MNGKERCLAAIRGEPVDHPPVFPLLMFFAKDRLGVTYRQYSQSGHVLAEAQLKARETFGVDAISACCDAFRISAALGGDIVFPEDQTPYLSEPLVRSAQDLARLKKPDMAKPGGRPEDRAQAIREMVRAAGGECLVLGWVDMPFAEACAVCGISEFMTMILEEPQLAHSILEFLTGAVVDFGLHQLEAGAPMIGAGDAAASLISHDMYREFALPYERRVCSAVHDAGGLIKLHICGDTSALLDAIVETGADLFNIDHLVDFSRAADVYGGADVCFKGNLDPVADMMQATPEKCRERCLQCLETAKGKRYMLSAGCEIPAGVTDEVFHAFCQAPRDA